MLGHFKLNNSKNGQSLIELGIFGAILIFCLGILVSYGMQANYRQYAEMKAYRKALEKARENYDTNGRTANMVFVDYKPIISPQDMFGTGGRSQYVSSSTVTWSNKLFSKGDSVEDDYVRKLDLTVNQDTDGKADVRYPLGGEFGIDCEPVWFKITDYPKIEKIIHGGEVEFKIIPKSDKYDVAGNLINRDQSEGQGDGIYWAWRRVDCGMIITPGDFKNIEIDDDREVVAEGGLADIDEDYKEEEVVGIAELYGRCLEGSYPNCHKFIADFLSGVDLQGGSIDTTIDSFDIAQGKEPQGLSVDNKIELTREDELVKQETAEGVTTHSELDQRYKITTYVGIGGGKQGIITDLQDEGRYYDWDASFNE